MEEDNNSVEEKQEYLRINILEKGYDANSFADYLVSKRGEDASDISTLTMNELQQEVKEFIQTHEKKNKKEEENNASKKEEDNNENEIENKDEDVFEIENEEENKNKNNEIITEENKIEIDEDNKIEDNNKIIENKDNIQKEKKETKEKKEKKEKKNSSKKETKKESKKAPKKESKKESKKEPQKEEQKVKEDKIENEFVIPAEIYGIICPHTYEDCKPLENTPLSPIEKPIITISSPEKVEGGFFTKTYITYLITTNEPKLNVRRRYSDFNWFHQALIDLYPYIVIPPIPKKNKIGIDNMSDIFISKRMRYLEKFLKWLVENPIIKNSQLFYDFLSIKNDEEFNKKKLEYQKITRPMNLIEFYSTTGKANLMVNKEKESYFKNISDNTYNNEILLTNLSLSLKQLKIQFDLFIEKVEEVQQNWEVLFINSTKYFEDINISNTYEKMSKLFTNWNDSLKKINKLIFVDVREYFKYIKNNFRDMKNNIYNVEMVKDDYYRFERFLRYKKDDLFNRGDITRWELDPQEKASAKTLAGDKLSALFKMCAKDTDRCIQRKVYYGYYLNQIIEEYERLRNFYGKLHKENQINFCKVLTEIISEFNKHVIENLTSLVIEENNDKKL